MYAADGLRSRWCFLEWPKSVHEIWEFKSCDFVGSGEGEKRSVLKGVLLIPQTLGNRTEEYWTLFKCNAFSFVSICMLKIDRLKCCPSLHQELCRGFKMGFEVGFKMLQNGDLNKRQNPVKEKIPSIWQNQFYSHNRFQPQLPPQPTSASISQIVTMTTIPIQLRLLRTVGQNNKRLMYKSSWCYIWWQCE